MTVVALVFLGIGLFLGFVLCDVGHDDNWHWKERD